MTGLWYLTYSIGTFFTTLISKNIADGGFLKPLIGDQVNYFWFFVAVMMGFVVLFIFVSPHIKEKKYLASDTLAEGLNIQGNQTREIHPDNPIV